jgi:quinol monooxygenase YgiN
MFYHVVMMSFSPEADDAFHARAQGYCDRVRAECSGVRDYFMAPNAAARSDGLTHAVIGLFDDEAAHDAYQVSPAHTEMKAYMDGFIARIVVYDGAGKAA